MCQGMSTPFIIISEIELYFNNWDTQNQCEILKPILEFVYVSSVIVSETDLSLVAWAE